MQYAKSMKCRKNNMKTGLFFALLLLVTTFTGHTMEPETNEITTGLPLEMRYYITDLFARTNVSGSRTIDVNTIRSLSKTNKEMNALINDPQFCLRIIKDIARRFYCSDETAAKKLHTKEAQNRLSIQKQFEKLIDKEAFDEKKLNELYNKYKDYVDLNFTYACTFPANNPFQSFNSHIDHKRTLLLITRQKFDQNNSEDGAAKVAWLLNTKKVNINAADTFGMTILMSCALKAQPELVTLLCEYPGININQKHHNGETALLFLCELFTTDSIISKNMEILINAGADPEMPNKQGLTPLKAIIQSRNEEAINLIKEAIRKKHEEK